MISPSTLNQIEEYSRPVAPALKRSRHAVHLHTINELTKGLRDSKPQHILLIGLLALSLLLPAITLLIAKSFDKASDNLQASRRISVFMSPQTSLQVAESLTNTLATQERISGTAIIEFNSDLLDADTQTNNNSPKVVEIIPRDTLDKAAIKELAAQLGTLAGVDFVALNADQLQDTEAASRLTRAMGRAISIVALACAALLVGVIIRFDLKRQQQQLIVLRQLGASSASIRKPFSWRGALIGCFAGCLGLATSWLLYQLSIKTLDLHAYHNLLPNNPGTMQLVLFLLISATAGAAASVLLLSDKFTFVNQ